MALTRVDVDAWFGSWHQLFLLLWQLEVNNFWREKVGWLQGVAGRLSWPSSLHHPLIQQSCDCERLQHHSHYPSQPILAGFVPQSPSSGSYLCSSSCPQCSSPRSPHPRPCCWCQTTWWWTDQLFTGCCSLLTNWHEFSALLKPVFHCLSFHPLVCSHQQTMMK